MNLRGNLIINNFYCVKCGFRMQLPRQKCKKRETGHLKQLYCCHCKEEVNFVECNDTSYSYLNYIEDKANGVFEGKEFKANA